MMRLCRDCAFFQPGESGDQYFNARCENEATASTNLVSGTIEPGFCGTERGSYGRCGPDGKLFVAAEAFAAADDATVGASALAG